MLPVLQISEVLMGLTKLWKETHNMHDPKKYMFNTWIRNELEELCQFFAIDKKLPEIYMFSDHGYEKLSQNRLGRDIQRIYAAVNRMDYKRRDGKEIYEQLFEIFIIPDNQIKEINNYPNLVPLRNGMYNLTTQTLREHDPRYHYTSVFTVDFTEDSQCPEFRKFMNRILPDKDLQMKVFCYMCYCMTPSIKFQIAQVWVGGGQNGKTELTSLFDLIMPNLVSHISMDQFMDGHKYLESELAHKYVNVGSEMSPSNFRDKGVQKLKRSITNKYQRMEAKYDSAVNFDAKCKQLYDLNSTPAPNSYTDYAFFRRWQIIPFVEHIPDEEVELEIMQRIFKEEGPQIVRFLLGFYDELLQWLKRDAPEAERLWAWHTLSVFVFIDNFCEIGGEANTNPTVEEAYDIFCLFCKNNNKENVSKNHFGRLLKSRGIIRWRPMEDESLMGITGYRPYKYQIEISYDEIDDLELKNQRVEKKLAFLAMQEIKK